ncbi:P-loop NTPase fold protein [Streptomyces sp. NPDC059460]|uniref:P-loop NTPase fold protein n=1 Tax=Streptomyces sp. NPDC059460 TaxID=3346840 RepID=UPI00367E32FC
MARERSWAIEDIAIAQSDQDLFDHRSVARQLTRTVKEVTQSLAVGLLGPFGSGKSSVVRLLTTELAVNDDWAVLHVSAEHHSGVARARALMYALLDAAHQKHLIDNKTYLGERACLEGSRQRTLPRTDGASSTVGEPARWRYLRAARDGAGWVLAMLTLLWLLGVGAVSVVHLLGAGEHVSPWTWFTPRGASSLTGVLVSAAAVAAVLAAGREGALQSLKAYEITVSSPRPDSTDELEQAFTRLLQHINRRLVIAVDDIDRLATSDVLDALATIRSFLLTGTQHRRPPVFILSCDEDIVREAIVGVRPGLAHRPTTPTDDAETSVPPEIPHVTDAAVRKATEDAAQEYLNKLFTIRMVLPTHHDADLRDYAEELLLSTPCHPLVDELGGQSATRTLLEVLIHRRVQEPRHVIRLLNSFCADYQLAQLRERPVGNRPSRIAPGEVTGYPIELARLTVLRHDFRDLYDAVRAEHRLLHLLDDALLGEEQPLNDPLLSRYRAPRSTGPLDLDGFPGLAYLKATAARARTQSPFQIGPLVTLGSSRASRLLGSQLATEIDLALVGRNGTTLAARLAESEQRTRVLQAATESLESARVGQDLDNAVVAALEALGSSADTLIADTSDDQEQAVHGLTDCIVRQLARVSLPVPSHLLVPLLGLTVPAHLLRIREMLRSVPSDPEEARAWAVALLALPAGNDSEFLAPSLDTYFSGLAESGDSRELAFWSNGSRQPTASVWPPAALGALLAMAARHDDGDTTLQARELITAYQESHGWDRSVLLGLLKCLPSSHTVRREALEALSHAPDPSVNWGESVNDSDAGYLATQFVESVARILQEDDDQECQLAAANLLIRWLPATQQMPEAEIAAQIIADAAASAADVQPELAAAADRMLHQLPEEPAAACATALSAHLANHRDINDAVGIALRDTLVGYLRRNESATSEPTKKAAEACSTALTADLETFTPTGRFARVALPLLLTTAWGRDMAASLAQRLISAVPPNDATRSQDLIPSLHLLLQDPAVRDSQLAPALQRLQQLISYGHPATALDFAAYYMAEPAVDVNWLNLFTTHWATLPQPARTRALAAAERPELSSVPGLRDNLVQHLLESEEAEPWRYATQLWALASTNQQTSLLAYARTRCPALGEHAAHADAELLSTAMAKSGDRIDDLLALLADAPALDDAVMLYLDHCLAQPSWDTDTAVRAIRASSASETMGNYVLSLMGEDQTSAIRATDLLATLVERAPDTLPADVVVRLTPVLMNAEPDLARALGRALRPLPRVAKRLRQAMGGHSSTSAQRARNAAFKEGSGI